MKESLEGRTKRGVAWSGVTTLCGQVLTFGLGVALARLLSPADFGVLAALIIFLEISSSIVSSGFVAALIQFPSIRKEHYATVWLVQLVLGSLVYFGLIVLSPFIAEFFRNELIGDVLKVLALYMFILPFISIPTAILRKAINFKASGLATLFQQLVSGGVSVTCAYVGFGVWSLVGGRLAGHLTNAIYLVNVSKWVPSWHFSLGALRDLIPYTGKMTLVNVLNDIAKNVDYVLVGRLLGAGQLGLYERAYTLMTLPLDKISNSINLVLFSAFSEAQHNIGQLQKGFLKATCVTSWFCAPVVVGLFWVAPELVTVLYGEKWIGTVAPLRIMSFAGLLLSLDSIAVSLITAMGFVGFELKRQAIYFVIMFVGVMIGSYWGLIGVATAVLVGAGIFLILLLILVRQLVKVQFVDYAIVLMPSLLGCAVMSVCLGIGRILLQNFVGTNMFTVLFTMIVVGGLSYFVYFLAMGNKPRTDVVVEVHREITHYVRSTYVWLRVTILGRIMG
ncbi:lipopolysaccharide biosynthesis protein [Candidatus Nitrospira neomarina]|uniref:Lipopolysaccharide biosynthesis protein n=1 Tax=Candidatus Nitrospira neomarina TaxID=3020899 RepID=A0AA96JY05_9BACT|nr:lipopolysaccharide biosynthesis protein [Candidatus Nitrospira neomarina]WNM63988.1 lipopolysaccharide biosynthesis protein [Candidatus Nitrospira neomarina]